MASRPAWGEYTVKVGNDKPHPIRYEFDRPVPLRIHYRVYRIPSRKVFLVCNYVDSTERDRAEVERLLTNVPQAFAAIARRTRRVWAREAGYWYWSWSFGTPVDDPFVQLELEMMIDQGAGGLIENG